MNDKYKYNFRTSPSKIHGNGIFANKTIQKKHLIGVGIYYYFIIPMITEDFGKWINHSYTPNSVVYYHEKNNKHYIVAIRDIKLDDEITINYNHTPWFIMGPESHYK